MLYQKATQRYDINFKQQIKISYLDVNLLK